MPTYGVTPAGFVAKPFAQVEAEIDADLQGILGASAGTNPDGTIPERSIAGQIKVFLADGFSAMWDLVQTVYASFDPNSATNNALDAVCSITGTQREPAQFATVIAICVGTPGTLLLKGRTVKASQSNTSAQTLADATIVGVGTWAASTAYAVGNIVTLGAKVYVCKVAGTSAGSGGPTGTGTAIVDGGVTWRFVGNGTGAVVVPCAATVAGTISFSQWALDTITTPVAGWTGVTNAITGVKGATQETDPALRVRRDAELAASGLATAEAIRARILAVNETSTDPAHAPPTACTVFVNNTDTTDTNGLPPHSVEILVLNGTDADIALAVWNSVGAGIAMYGNQTSTITDSQGNVQTVKWSRPTAVPIYIVATVYYDAKKWPAVGAAALVREYAKSALWTFGNGFPVGQSVRSAPLAAAILDEPSAVDSLGAAILAPPGATAPIGLLDVSPLYIGTAPSPGTSTPIVITSRQIATVDPSNITITATLETP